MTNVVSIFTKAKKSEPGSKANTAISHIDQYIEASSGSQDTHGAQTDVAFCGDRNVIDRSSSKFSEIEQANADRLKKLEEERKKNNQIVLKSYKIK